MSDEKLDLKLNVDVDVHDADKARALREELERIDAELRSIAKHTSESFRGLGNLAKSLGRVRPGAGASAAGSRDAVDGERDLLSELKKRWSFERRMNAQRRSEEGEAARAARDEAREVEARFRAQLAWNSRIAAQRAREEKAAETAIQREIRETGRMRDREARAAVKAANDARRAQEQALARAGHGAGRVRSGVGHAAVAGGAVGIGAAYLGERTIDALTRSGVELDKAVTANTRLSGLDPKAARAKGADLAKQYAPIARGLGLKTSQMLAARAEALQAGVDEQFVDAVTQQGSKYAILNDMNPSEVMESSGYGITALSAFGKVDEKLIAQLFNKQQYLAATTAASRQGLASFVRRGLSAGAAAGFNLDDTLAYGGAATSSGADGESAARMLSSTTERIASLPTRMADIQRKKNKSIRDRALLSLPKKLGFASWKDLKQAFSADSAGVMEQIYEGLATVQDPRERLEMSEEIFGKEFGSVHAAMAVGHRFRDMRKSVRSKDAANAIDSGMAIKSGAYDFVMNQISSTIQSMKDGLGMVLLPFWSNLRDWVLKAPKAFDSLNEAFRAGISGLLSGLGSPDGTMAGALKAWFGDPGTFTVNAKAVADFARGIGQGLREIGSAIVSFVRVFAGSNGSPEQIGLWTTRIIGLSAALLVAAPAVAIMGGIATAIGGMATAIIGAWGLLKGAGIVGAAGAGPKIPGGPAAAASEGWLATFGRLLGIGAFAPTAGLNKGDQDALGRKLGAYALELEKQKKATEENNRELQGSTKEDTATKLNESIKANTEALNKQLKAEADKAKAAAGGDAYAKTMTEIDNLKNLYGRDREDAIKRLGDPVRSDAAISGTVGEAVNQGIRARANRAKAMRGTPGVEAPGQGDGAAGGGNEAHPDNKSGGSRSWRNNNPGNLEYGAFAKANGAIGSDGRFAKFPTYEAGRKAQEKLLFESKGYRDLTLAQAIRRYAPAHENDVGAYIRATGADPSMRMADFSPSQRAALQDAMQKHEGWKKGTIRGGGDAVAGVPDAAAGGVLSRMQSLQRAGQVANEQCVALAKAAVGASGSVMTWRKGENAEAGTMKPGTPLATFLNRDGSQSDRYAGGGVGTPGAKLDHAVVFDSYVRDKNGRIIGMNVAEQYKGSGGVRAKRYMFGQGRGEANGSNYYAIKGPDGQYLGGKNNPMNGAGGAGTDVAESIRAEKEKWESIGDGMRRTPWLKTPTFNGGNRIDDLVSRPGQGSGTDITAQLPHRLGVDAPIRGGAQGGSAGVGGARGPTIHVTQNISGAHHSPEELANTVNRRLSDEMRRRAHDTDFNWG